MEKILLIEDDESVLEALKESLADEGYILDTTTCGADALKLITKHPYDVIISDMNLGDTTGINILKATRGISPDTKFILTTAYSSIESAVEAIRHGIYDYIIKPFDSAELKFRVRQAIEKLKMERQHRHINNRYRIIMDNIPYGIAIISPEMEIVEVNKHLLQWFPEIEISETPLCFKALCTPPNDTRCPECPIEKTIKTGTPHTYRRQISLNGRNITLQSTVNLIIDESGKITGILKVIEEIKE